MTCHCGKPMHRFYHSFHGTWMWRCPEHGMQKIAEMPDTQLTLEHEEGWR